MGLTSKAMGKNIFKNFYKDNESDIVVALLGNPNVGKSTIFNNMTGMNEHTGNWTGKTVEYASSKYTYNEEDFVLVDLPGTYSLIPTSKEEEVTRDFIAFNNPLVTVVVVDACSLERNLSLLIQAREISNNVILCINLMDEAKKKKIEIDLDILEKELNVPIVTTSIDNKNGIEKLKNKIYKCAFENNDIVPLNVSDNIRDYVNNIDEYLKTVINYKNTKWLSLMLLCDDSIKESIHTYLNYDVECDKYLVDLIKKAKENVIDISKTIAKKYFLEATRIFIKSVTLIKRANTKKKEKMKNFLKFKKTGMLVMILLFSLIFFITIKGANLPSELLSKFLFGVEKYMKFILRLLSIPPIIINALIDGVYKTLAWVISVMLPPMAIFFPLFALLEDSGYLPRISFNMDKLFQKCGTSGKQSLTMCMGCGCNACGVMGARIISNKKERLIAILTNVFMPCNGRFPTLITLIIIFITSNSIFSSLTLMVLIIISVFTTLLISKILSKLLNNKDKQTFILELPPYRKPSIIKTIIRSFLDKTLAVLKRAIIISIPMGLLIWVLSNTYINDIAIIKILSQFLDPFAKIFGLDGVILLSFILGFPANEIVLPIAIMIYQGNSSLTSLDINSLNFLLIENGWNYITAICTMIFCLMHFPCGTTVLTIKKETGSVWYTLLSIVIPTLVGLILCFLIKTILLLII